MDMWTEELRHVELSSDVGRAEQCLQVHSDAALHVQNCIIEVIQVGQDLLPVSSNYACFWLCISVQPPDINSLWGVCLVLSYMMYFATHNFF